MVVIELSNVVIALPPNEEMQGDASPYTGAFGGVQEEDNESVIVDGDIEEFRPPKAGKDNPAVPDDTARTSGSAQSLAQRGGFLRFHINVSG